VFNNANPTKDVLGNPRGCKKFNLPTVTSLDEKEKLTAAAKSSANIPHIY
jgi:hypothetical protein